MTQFNQSREVVPPSLTLRQAIALTLVKRLFAIVFVSKVLGLSDSG
jgi:hypothetical protein